MNGSGFCIPGEWCGGLAILACQFRTSYILELNLMCKNI